MKLEYFAETDSLYVEFRDRPGIVARASIAEKSRCEILKARRESPVPSACRWNSSAETHDV